MAAKPPVARFTQNKGQWPVQVAYRALVPGGALFVERNALTYTLHSGGLMEQHGHEHDGPPEPEHAHAFRVSFEGASQAVPAGAFKQGFYENYFLGNDPEGWGTGCAVYGEVLLQQLYPGIDLRMDGRSGLKYDFIVAPGSDPSLVRLHFEGQDGLSLKDGRLFVKTSAGTVIEEAPVAYQETPSGRKEVRCTYNLNGSRVSFDLPDGYDPSLALVIDPVLTFGTYSGSTADNFGFTATYDAAGHLYGGGIVFGAGYPTTVGVLDPVFNGGTIDIGLTKFSPDGTAQVWSTYIGGSGNECPHSLVVNSNNELYMMGSSGSANFPTTGGAFDQTFHGGSTINASAPTWAGQSYGYGYGHTNGTDIVLAHFSADATSLIACTYVGGSGNDGVNNVLPLSHNYGDHFRGEVALDASEWPVVSTSTQSADIPVSANAPQPAFGGGVQDAYVFRMDPTLTTLQASFFGGSGNDSGYGVQFDSNGQIFTTGGTTSTDLSTPGTPLHSTNAGGVDGYVARWSSDLGGLLSATYLGTAAFDQSYFVQVDNFDAIYVVGQTHGAYPVSSGVYANPGSSQFIQKLSNDLSSSIWSTVIGSGLGNEDISPTAFLVSNCGQIYFCGWGGLVNHNMANAGASTTVGLPTTTDAFQSTTDGSDFYLMLLDPDAVGLNYATFFGGSASLEHVDGGTSRFDKDGTVYQAVCAGCGNHDDFPTTPGAWSNTNNSFNCNLGVFKFELAEAHVTIGIDGPNTICIPGSIQFTNSSTGGDTYLWDFGDGSTSTDLAPAHVYTTDGTFSVSMILSDSYGCTTADSATIEVISISPTVTAIDPAPAICPNADIQLQVVGGTSWIWSPSTGLSNDTLSNPVATPVSDSTLYQVISSGVCGTDTATVLITWLDPVGSAGMDTSVCVGSGIALNASGGGTYLWSPAATLSDPTIQNPIASPLSDTQYAVVVTTPEGCTVDDNVLVTVFTDPPLPALTDTVICPGASVQLHAGDAAWYAWHAAPGIADLTVQDPEVSPNVATMYVVDMSNACGTLSDSAFVDLAVVQAQAWPDTLICAGSPVTLHASGGTTYAWSPVPSATDSLRLDPAAAGTYSVTITNALGCTASAQVQVDLHPAATVTAGYETSIDYGESTMLHAYGLGTFIWSPDSSLSCSTCAYPIASPLTTTTYVVEITDTNGCKATDRVTIFFRGTLFVPNTFTPNGDGVNDRFYALSSEVSELRLLVFNRWGEQIFSTDQLDGAWDGTFKGKESPIDTYVWRVDYTETNGTDRTVYGHVNLVR
ncbi:MAG: gliding motility-associated C-terminal domain-containing protein [Flavobacteriales bacterium]